MCVSSLQCVDSVTLLSLSLLISLLYYYYYYIMMMMIIIITISIDPYEYHMDNESCSSGGLSLVAKPSLRCTGTLSHQQTSNHDKNFIVGHYMQTVQPTFFLSCHAYRHLRLLPFYTTFTDLDLAWGSRDPHKGKPIGLGFFLHTFHLMKMKFDMAMKQFKLNTLRLLLSKIC